MKIFPSDNEKIITAALIAFLLGAIIGIFSAVKITEQSILLPAIATLVAAFLGAWAAYKLQDNKNKREYEKTCLENGNNILFSLYERIKALKLIKTESIDPHRDDPLRMVLILPLLSFSYPDSEFKIESLLFFLETKHKQLMLDLHVEKERFNIVFNLIKFRSDLHFRSAQPALEKSELKEDSRLTREQIENALGERVFHQLERATDDLVDLIDETIESGEEIKARLVSSLKDLFPGKIILNYEFQK